MIDEEWMKRYDSAHNSAVQLMMGGMRSGQYGDQQPYGLSATLAIIDEPEFWINNELYALKLNTRDVGEEIATELILGDTISNSWCNPNHPQA